MLAEAHWLAVTVHRGVAHRENRHQRAAPPVWPLGISSVQTRKLFSVFGPNVVVIATSVASRPRAIRMRPILGTLLRGSNMCHRPWIHASNHAAKSPGGNESGV